MLFAVLKIDLFVLMFKRLIFDLTLKLNLSTEAFYLKPRTPSVSVVSSPLHTSVVCEHSSAMSSDRLWIHSFIWNPFEDKMLPISRIKVEASELVVVLAGISSM